jgi:hypothetical protein
MPGFLRRFREAVEVASECDHRMTGAPPCDPGGRDAGDAPRHHEAVLLEHVGQVFRGFEFLVRQLAKTENRVVDDLGELAPCLDAFNYSGLESLDLRAPLFRFHCLLGPRRSTHQKKGR